MTKKTFSKRDIPAIIFIILSSALYSIGMNTFVAAGNLFPGGFSGLSRLIVMVLSRYAGISLEFGVIYFALNITLLFFVWRRIGHKFALYSALWFTMTSMFTGMFPKISITEDPLLISVFGGLLGGTAIGIALRNNASSGGTDFIAIYYSMKYNKPTWNYILAGNAVILFFAGLLFGWSQALYSIIYQYVSTQTVSLLHQRYKLTRLDVVTNKPDEICDAVFHTCRHGITKVPVEGGYTDQKHWLLLITINTYQLKDVLDTIKAVDPHVFITLNAVERIVGNYYQKPLE